MANMNNGTIALDGVKPKTKSKGDFFKKLNQYKYLYLLMLPGVLYFIVFKYVPMWGVLIAFKNYQPFSGFWASEWVGFQHFQSFFSNPDFYKLLKNTLILSAYNLIFFFPAPIILALLMNEIRRNFYKRIVQSMLYVPHFVSMVIVASITYVFLTTEGGLINSFLVQMTGKKIDFLSDPHWFRPLIILQVIWKECGWGTIIFLAALAGVEVEQYEAAIVDGANRFQQLVNITLPAIKTTIIILLVLRMGNVLDNGFEQIYLMTNSLNRDVADVFDTYVYNMGITQGSFSYSTAVGLFKSLIGIVLIQSSNFLAKKLADSSIF